ALMRRHPGSRPVALTYARVLVAQGGEKAGRRAQEVLRPLLARSANDAVFQHTYARACELAGDSARAGEAHADVAFPNRPAARARIDARIAAITPTVLELRRQGVRDPDMQRR